MSREFVHFQGSQVLLPSGLRSPNSARGSPELPPAKPRPPAPMPSRRRIVPALQEPALFLNHQESLKANSPSCQLRCSLRGLAPFALRFVGLLIPFPDTKHADLTTSETP